MKILVVEDDQKIANALKRGLEQHGFDVDVAYRSDTGLGYALKINYDLCIFDRMLPGEKNGIEMVKILRKEQFNMPILILTAKSRILDKAEGLNAGADDYLVKPFAFVELIARIRALLRRNNQQNLKSETLLTYKDLTLNKTTKVVKRASSTINLTAKEYALLEFLLENPNRVLNKDVIIQNVWEYDSDILPNTLEVYIGYLRSKIDKPFKDLKNLIHTKRGFGYYFGELK